MKEWLVKVVRMVISVACILPDDTSHALFVSLEADAYPLQPHNHLRQPSLKSQENLSHLRKTFSNLASELCELG